MSDRFPAYLRTSDRRHFYRIESATAFTEVQMVGSRAVIHRVTQAAYPEQVRIAGMLEGTDGGLVSITSEEFHRALDMHDGK